jgi:hypothetical protein
MLQRTFLILNLLLVCTVAIAQKTFTINGNVKDGKNGEDLIGATVTIKGTKAKTQLTNAYGFFTITLPQGEYVLTVSSAGFSAHVDTITLYQDITLRIEMAPAQKALDEVVVKAQGNRQNVKNPVAGVVRLDIKEMNKIPVLLGERDVLKVIQLTPGVKSAGEGNAGFYVRGGGADENLILLDEAPVYNASHLLGFFSVFNSDAIKNLTLYKGGMPAQFGGRLSSVLDLRMNDGNNKRFNVSGGIGVISSRLLVEGPIVKNKGSFMISGRRTYADMFLRLSPDSNLKNNQLYFYDVNMKANYTLGKKDRIFLSGYFGKDVLGLRNQFGIDWGNATGTFRWNHVYNKKLFSNTSLIFSNYSFRFTQGSGSKKITYNSQIDDINLKTDFEYFVNSNHKLKYGVNFIRHKFRPGIFRDNSNSANNSKITDRFSIENAAYIQHEWNLTENISINYGLRLATFHMIGPGKMYTYNDSGIITSLKRLRQGVVGKSYYVPEPRLLLSYSLKNNNSIKFGYARNSQNVHLLSNSTSANPNDLWIPSSNIVKPGISDQLSLGYYQNIGTVYEFSTETYYKVMQNQIDYKNGANLGFNENVEADLVFGKGQAYGIELFFKKRTGKLTGWVGYTLSRTERSFEKIENGRWFAAKMDRTHDVSVVAMYDLTKKLQLAASWIYSTGNAVTFPSGKYEINGEVFNLYTERNGYRMPAYHRMDIGLTWLRKKTTKFESSWNFSIYNAYNRANPFSITFRPSASDRTKTEAVQTTLFKLVPSITYNFKFL